jgi:hypothetical protein
MEFTNDDTRIISSSLDGSIYEWQIGVNRQINEFYIKRSVCTHIAVSSSNTILAYFEDARVPMESYTSARRASLTKQSNSVQLKYKPQHRLCIFENNLKSAPDSFIEILLSVTALCVCDVKLASSDLEKLELCFLGFEDGSILISHLPIPLRSIQQFQSFNSLSSLNASSVDIDVGLLEEQTSSLSNFLTASSIDTAQCKTMHLHRGAVTSLAASECGSWVFTGGNDGSLFMLATNYKALNTVITSDTGPLENTLTMTDLALLRALQMDVSIKSAQMNGMASENQKQLDLLRLEKDEVIEVLERKLDREVSKRDRIIVNEREDHLKSLAQLHSELNESKERSSKEQAAIEHEYEQRMAQESLYLHQSMGVVCIYLNRMSARHHFH